jgi:hypothetical protein
MIAWSVETLLKQTHVCGLCEQVHSARSRVCAPTLSAVRVHCRWKLAQILTDNGPSYVTVAGGDWRHENPSVSESI